MTFHVLGPRQEDFPIASALVHEEDQHAAAVVLRVLKELEPEAIKSSKFLISDLSHSYELAWDKVVGTPIKKIDCGFHFVRKINENIKSKEMNSAIHDMRFCTKKELFLILYNVFKQKYADAKEGKWFLRHYGFQGIVSQPQKWSKAYLKNYMSHNLQAEGYHRNLKRLILPNMAIDQTMWIIQAKNEEFDKKFINILNNVFMPLSDGQKTFLKKHPKTEDEYCNYTFTFESPHMVRVDGGHEPYFVTIWSDEDIPCSHKLCLVHCKFCPPQSPCSHRFSCTCYDAAREHVCKHAHYINIKCTEELSKLLPPIEAQVEEAVVPVVEEVTEEHIDSNIDAQDQVVNIDAQDQVAQDNSQDQVAQDQLKKRHMLRTMLRSHMIWLTTLPDTGEWADGDNYVTTLCEELDKLVAPPAYKNKPDRRRTTPKFNRDGFLAKKKKRGRKKNYPLHLG